MVDKAPRGAWQRALSLADQTPASRNRYVDLLRAIAISCVVLGHWVMAAPYVGADGHADIEHLLAIAPWSQWLTWGFQVMPVFFFVGGFSNATSWASTQRKNGTFRDWFASRLQRLLGPVLALLTFWTVGAAIALAAGAHPEFVRVGSQIALIPIWFLAVYILVCMFVPLTYRAWEKWGYATFWVPVLCAAGMDALFFTTPAARPATWSNYLFIWLAVHQLGYAWRDGLRGGVRSLVWGLAGLAALVAMTQLGPYPLSLVGVPGQALDDGTVLSNTRPPKLPLLALGLAQIGTMLSLQGPANRLLQKRVPWAATVLANGMIMTVFLWHSTAMMLLFGLGFVLGGIGVEPYPCSGAWWAIRPVWIVLFAVGTFPCVMLFQRFERTSGRPAPHIVRSIIGCLAACVGLALLAISGINMPETTRLNWVALACVFGGCGVAGFGPIGAALARIGGATGAPSTR